MTIAKLLLTAVILLLARPGFAGLRVVVSVDWEGRDLNPENLAVMEAFRKDYPDVPLQHFLNAAYFTKPEAKAKETVEAMRRVLREGDEQGLHIHAWKSLVEASGVTFRTEPAFKGPMDISKCDPDCGHDINIAAYTGKELQRIIHFSIQTLGKNGFKKPKSFRAGAWQADNHVFRALLAEGITLDSSATYAEFLKVRWGKTLLYPVTAKIWPKTTPTSQPYTIDLGEGKKILELPNNGCLADYVTGEQILQTFKENVELWRKDPTQTIYVSIGFHQETAQKFLERVRAGIDAIRVYAEQEKVPLEFVVPPLT